LNAAGIDNTLRWVNVQQKDILRLTKAILESTYSVIGRGEYRDEFVTCGGVPLSELKMSSLQSKIVEGLYLAGECIDVDGVTGGYNFQSAWSTGYIAGDSAGKDIINNDLKIP
jgi:predicted flavoprotein YhiN